MELDFWIPKHNLALEFQGHHHYIQLYKDTKSEKYENQNRRDREKRRECEALGITMIEIPFWWDKTQDQLLATIKTKRPDIFPNISIEETLIHSKPIPDELPSFIEIAQHFMLTTDWDPEICKDFSGWLMSEKYDGTRAYWNGKNFFQRNGGIIISPRKFRQKMPSLPLDGELWTGKHTFSKFQNYIASQYHHDHKEVENEWTDVTYHVFDAPSQAILPLEKRLEIARTLIPTDEPRIKMVSMEICRGNEHLMQTLVDVVDDGGEGVVLRKPDSEYKSGKSSEWIRVKPYYLSFGKVTETQRTLSAQNMIGTCFRFKGRVSERHPNNTLLLYEFDGLSLNGSPRSAAVAAYFPGLTMDSVVSFCLGTGEDKRNLQRSPKCQTCGKRFEHGELRVQVKGMLKKSSETDPTFQIFSFCTTADCVRNDRIAFIPRFTSQIGVPARIEKARKNEGTVFLRWH
eukprot:TRINITY_DN5712_c0_g1_i3.p1 TRINITY_DN5712_c0_g1~~TRINITY_DN5712_c0_g1_i3.p1  ORF type:complete len:458 (-),score=93.25 TRINITY_DN5712_c0_g1_i3:618-1991(-)